MKLTRRSFLHYSLGALAVGSPGQGVVSRKAKAEQRMAPSGRPFNARFTDIAKEAGLVLPVVYGEADHKDYILETVGCGCAFFDYDNDGWMDIFLLSGSSMAGAPSGASNRLYRNNRDGTFTDVTKQAGLENSKTRWGAGCTFVDYNRDGHLDLFVSNYVQFDATHIPKPGQDVYCNWKGVPVNCGPRGLPPGYHSLYRNNGNGTFTDVSVQAGIDGLRSSYGMTVVAADFDEDGWPDIFVACDSTPSLLLMNQRNGTFREEGVIRGVALSDDGMEQAGMGVGVGDYDLDGHLDLFKTHFTDDTGGLFHNNGKAEFENTTMAAHVGTENRYICWGAGIVDLDNDGFPDLFMTAGSVYPEVEKTLPQYPNKNPRVVFRNLGNGSFEELIEEAGPGVAAAHSSRGCAFGDFDNDGDLDILIVNLSEAPSLLRNDVSGNNHWLKVQLVGTKSNRSAIGARVLARYGRKIQAQEVLSQSSFYSASDRRLHFGLGGETSADLEIRWPSGMRESLKGVTSNQMVVVKEGMGIVSGKKSVKG